MTTLAGIKNADSIGEPAFFRNGVYYSYTILKSEGLAYLVYVVEFLPGEEFYSNVLVALVA